ncbi:MAG: GxxExxY protein [Candidatus Firestonebacteria bacterium]
MIDSIEENKITEKIIGLCFKVHSSIGPGFTERIYQNSLVVLLKQENITYETEKPYALTFAGNRVGNFRLDLVIENKVILELKSLAGNIPKIFESQMISYLKASGLRVGLLINFGNKSCQIKRVSHY